METGYEVLLAIASWDAMPMGARRWMQTAQPRPSVP